MPLRQGRNEVFLVTVARQVEHHKTESFQDEFRRLGRNGIEIDKRYVWD